MHWCEVRGGLEGWRAAHLCWEGGEGRSWGGRECGCSLLSGTLHARLVSLRQHSPERGHMPCPLLGHTLLSVRLDM